MRVVLVGRLEPDREPVTFPLGILAGNTVSCLAVQADGRVLVGGNFSFVPGVVPGGLVRLHPDGATDPAFLDGMQGVEGTVNTLAIQADGRILVGGSFVRVNGEERRRVARLEADGRLDPDFLPGASGPDGEVSVIGLEPDGQIVIGGSFSAVGASTRKGLARLQADGSVDVTYREGASGYSGSVYALARDVEGRLITGGEFVSVDGVQQRRLARLDAKGVWDPTFRHGVSAIYGTAVDVVQLGDGSVMVAGLISLTNGTAFLARFDVGGSLDIDFRLGLRTTGLDDFNLALQPDGRLIVTGPSFTQPSPLGRVFRLASDLTFDAGFMSGLAGPDGNVRAAVFGLDGKVLLGGSFQKVNGTSRKRIACLNPDGSLDGGFLNGLGGADATVHAMAIQPDGRVLLGGQFRTVNGVARGRVARLLPDGSLDTGFLDGLGGADTNVFALALQADGKVLVGGDFTTMNGQARNRLARLHADGTLDESFLQGLSGVDGRVEEMMVQPDGCVVIVGRFAVCHGVQRRGVARLGPDGRLDAGFVCDVNGDPPWVAGVARQRDGDLLIAGGFSIVNGEPAACVARVYGGPAARPVILKQQVLADGSGIRVEFVGVRGVPHRVWRSADLRSWEEAGPATEVTPGGFEYRDVEGAGSAARFYRTG